MLYPSISSSSGDELADLVCRVLPILRHIEFARVRRRDRVAFEVVYQLGVDVSVRPVDGEPGALRRPENLAPDASPTFVLVGPLGPYYRHTILLLSGLTDLAPDLLV